MTNLCVGKGEDGKAIPIEQHHSLQKGDGPIFEIKQTTHKNPVNKKALHPYGKKRNPNNPVNRKEWDKDKKKGDATLLS